MKFGKYYVSAIVDRGITHENEEGDLEVCGGYFCQVFADEEMTELLDDFCLPIGYAIEDESFESLEEGIREYLGTELTEARKDEIIDKFLTWMIEHHRNDEDLFYVLHKHIGMSKSELHQYSIDSLDKFFKANNPKKDVTTDLITAEDLAQQAIYAANAPKGATVHERASAMLGMLGANINNESVFEDKGKEIPLEQEPTDMPETFVITGATGTLVELSPEVVLYNSIDYMGKPQFNLGIRLYCNESGSVEPYANLTVNFHEFIGAKNCAYIDTNNCPFADEILKTGIAKDTGLTKRSGYCEYPLWQFDENYLKLIGGETYEMYSSKYDECMSFENDDEETEVTEESDDEDFDEEPCFGM